MSKSVLVNNSKLLILIFVLSGATSLLVNYVWRLIYQRGFACWTPAPIYSRDQPVLGALPSHICFLDGVLGQVVLFVSIFLGLLSLFWISRDVFRKIKRK